MNSWKENEMEDPIVSEVRKYRKRILESYGSIRAYHEAVMESQEQYGNRLIKDASKYSETTSNKKNAAD